MLYYLLCIYTSQSAFAWCTLVVSSVQLFFNPMDCILPGSSAHGISQATILDWVAISFYRRSNPCCVSCIGRQILYHCATWEALKCFSLFYFILFYLIFNSVTERTVITILPKGSILDARTLRTPGFCSDPQSCLSILVTWKSLTTY